MKKVALEANSGLIIKIYTAAENVPLDSSIVM